MLPNETQERVHTITDALGIDVSTSTSSTTIPADKVDAFITILMLTFPKLYRAADEQTVRHRASGSFWVVMQRNGFTWFDLKMLMQMENTKEWKRYNV